MIGRYAAAIGLALLFAIVFGFGGTRGLSAVVFLCAPLVLAALVSGLTHRRLAAAALIGLCVGFLPAVIFATVNELFGGQPPSESIAQTKEAGSVLILMFWGIPGAVAGLIGGFLGVLLRKPETVVPD